MTYREAHLVELVNDAGRAIGRCRVDEAHQPPGRLHRAFSVLLTDVAPHAGETDTERSTMLTRRVLLQQRATVKTRFPLRWANSCCGHPAPGESLTVAANRRLREELGVGPVTLTEVGTFVYRAADPATGRIEVEYDHVLCGELSATDPLRPDPGEVAGLRWVHLAELHHDLRVNSDRYAPWLAQVIHTVSR